MRLRVSGKFRSRFPVALAMAFAIDAAAGRHQHQAVAAVGYVANDFFLRAAKGRQAEYGIEDGQRVGGIVAGTCHGRGHY